MLEGHNKPKKQGQAKEAPEKDVPVVDRKSTALFLPGFYFGEVTANEQNLCKVRPALSSREELPVLPA